jgi:hypothetical protein
LLFSAFGSRNTHHCAIELLSFPGHQVIVVLGQSMAWLLSSACQHGNLDERGLHIKKRLNTEGSRMIFTRKGDFAVTVCLLLTTYYS